MGFEEPTTFRVRPSKLQEFLFVPRGDLDETFDLVVVLDDARGEGFDDPSKALQPLINSRSLKLAFSRDESQTAWGGLQRFKAALSIDRQKAMDGCRSDHRGRDTR